MHRVRRVVDWGVTVLLAMVFIASFACLIMIRIITDDLLDPTFYTQALIENDIYDRVYSDLLADPAMRGVAVQLLGRTQITPKQSHDAYGQIVSALRLVLPPEIIEEAGERIAVEFTAYLKGSRHRLRGNIVLTRAVYDPHLSEKVIASVASVETVLIAQMRSKGTLLASNGSAQDVSLAVLVEQIESYLIALANGKPADLPPLIKTFPIEHLSSAEKRQLARTLLVPAGERAPAEMERQVEASLAADDLPGALVLVSGTLVDLRAEEAIANLRARLDSGTLSGVKSLAELADRTAQDIIREINHLRDLVGFFNRRLQPLAAGLMLFALGGLAVQHRRSLLRLQRVLGVVFMLSGGGVIAAWSLLEVAVDNPWMTYRAAGISSGDLPGSLAVMLNDVLGSLRANLRLTVWMIGAVPLVCGLVLLAVAELPGVRRRVWTWLARLERRAWVGMAAAVIALVAGLLLVDVRREAPASSVTLPRCNGSADLCERPFNEVVFAATHNAMSVASEGWVWPNQDGSLTLQLEAGVRALLIDTHYGDSTAKIDAFVDRLPASMRPLMYDVLATTDPLLQDPTQVLLCHSLCSLGGIPLVDALGSIRAFLDDHPREVVVLLIQDGISTADTVRAFEASDLVRTAYAHPPGEAWPTLGQMIAADKRLVVFAEVNGPPPDWYHHMWDYVGETSYQVSDPAQFDCLPNRGGVERPLFLMNHWISNKAPDRVDAARINNGSFLLSRADLCAEQRGQIPNFIAVDFYSVGDLLQVVDELNALPGES